MRSRTQLYPQALFLVVVVGVLLSGGMRPAVAQFADDLFEQYDVVTGFAERQTVLTGFLLDGPMADLAVAHIDESGDRRLRIYALGGAGDGSNGAGEPRVDAALRPAALFLDVANIGGRDRLITYESGRLNWFDPDSATERVLVEVAASYRATDQGVIPHVDITRDLNHDGLDDLVIPEVDGFWIATQLSDGSFADAVKLGPPEPFAGNPVGHLDVDEPASEAPRTWGDVGITAATVPVYLSRVYEMDCNQDGLSDLVFWNDDHFDVYHQNERGLFDPVADTFPVEVPFDSDGVYSRAFQYSDQGVFSAIFGLGKKTQRTVLHSIRDLNGDRVADLVTLTLAGRSITRQRSVFDVRFGAPTPEGTVFARDVSMPIQPKGKAGGMQPWGYASQIFEDLDGDGQVDILFKDVAVGIGGMMRALVGNSVPINLEFYRMEDGVYPDEPTTKIKIRDFAPFAGLGNVFFPAVLLGDVNGDGRSDLVVGKRPKELHVFLGVSGPDLFEPRPRKVAVALPHDERNSWLVDLNKDGKQDVLMHRGPTDHAPAEPHRLTILIAR